MTASAPPDISRPDLEDTRITGGGRGGPGPAQRAARSAALVLLRRLRRGEITLVDGGEVHRFGTAGPECALRARIDVHSPAFYTALLNGSRGLALSYMAGEWDCDDVVTLTRIASLNMGGLDRVNAALAPVTQPLKRAVLRSRVNTRRRSREHIARHYDLGNDLFALMLDRSMMYSCAYFESSDVGLDEAQFAKLERICRKLDLRPDDHLLEIGTGWGGLSVHAAARYGCRVTTTTISQAQHDLAVERVARAGLENRVTVLLEDYRDLRGSHDKLVSVEMIEAIGPQYLDTFFERCGSLLARDGLMLLQAITMADSLYRASRYSRGFTKDIIFPGGCLFSVEAMLDAARRHTDLRLLHLEDISPHYAQTLRCWRERFLANLDRVRALGYDERFVRMWTLYLSYCEGAFRERRIHDVQMVMGKPAFRGEAAVTAALRQPVEVPTAHT